MSELDQLAMGRLIEAVDTLKDEVEKLRGDVAALNVSVANIQGGWKAVAGFSAAVGGLISVGIIKVAPIIGLFPK